ncbi:MAG TPA: hypothetical protein VH684_03025 [Xanthobacteraceae bacterium]|jgi:hypothetical protein
MTGKLELTFSTKLTSEERDLAEASVRGMIEKASAEAAAVQALRAQRQELQRAAAAPIDALILADDKAAAALKVLSKDAPDAGGFEPLRPADFPGHQGSRLPTPRVSPFTLAIPAVPPFSYAWSSIAHGSGPPTQNYSDVQGNLIANVKSGSIVGGANTFVNAHCGVGVVFSLDRTASVSLSGTLDFQYKYLLACHGLSASATVDGGLEASLSQGPTVISYLSLPIYHKRLSGFEHETVGVPFATQNFPQGMASQVGPGTYGFNLGIWAVSNYSGGIGGAAAQSACQAMVREMWIVAP